MAGFLLILLQVVSQGPVTRALGHLGHRSLRGCRATLAYAPVEHRRHSTSLL